jgi:hypothetical protein
LILPAILILLGRQKLLITIRKDLNEQESQEVNAMFAPRKKRIISGDWCFLGFWGSSYRPNRREC